MAEAVLVTAYGSAQTHCKLASTWTNVGTALAAPVICTTISGNLIDSPFTITLIGSNAVNGRLAMAVADKPSQPSYPAASNAFSSGQGILISRTGTGRYSVKFVGLSRPSASSTEIVMVTTIGGGGERCSLDNRGILEGEDVSVVCFPPQISLTNPVDTRFAIVLIERGRASQRAGYGQTEHPPPINFIADQSFSSAGPIPVLTRLPTAGLYEATFANLAGTAPPGRETVQVAARTGIGSICKIVSWRYAGTALIVTVQCYSEDGKGVADQYFKILVLQ
jgi:hypothetical protein